jgi:hypothetical protein
MSNSNKHRPAFVKEVAAPTISQAVISMDDWGQSIYDMYVVSCGPYEGREGYVVLTLFGWQNNKSREDFRV